MLSWKKLHVVCESVAPLITARRFPCGHTIEVVRIRLDTAAQQQHIARTVSEVELTLTTRRRWAAQGARSASCGARTRIRLCVLLTLPADSRSAPRASTDDDECAAPGQRAASALAAGLSTEARLAAGSAHAECLRAHQDHVGIAEALGRIVSDVGLKAAHPLAVVHASNQVAELAMAGHIEWQQAERVFRELHSGWAGNAASLRSHGLVCTQTGAMERAIDLFEASVRLHPDDYTHSQAVILASAFRAMTMRCASAGGAAPESAPGISSRRGLGFVKLGRYRERATIHCRHDPAQGQRGAA